LSADGRYMVFASDADNRGSFIFGKSNWHPLDGNQTRDVFMVERRVGEVLWPNQGILRLVGVWMDNHPTAYRSIRVFRAQAFDGGSNTRSRGRIDSIRIFANDVELTNVRTVGIGTESAYAWVNWTVPSVAGPYQVYAVTVDDDNNRVVSTPNIVDVRSPES